MEFRLPYGSGVKREGRLLNFAEMVLKLSDQIGFKVSSRGWCYILEGKNLITKAEFGHCQNIINECRKKGFLPIKFVAEEDARNFQHIERIDSDTSHEYLKDKVDNLNYIQDWYDLSFWEGQEYYIQMLVEKVDLVTLFAPICSAFHIPIATSKGWSSILQRAELIERFSEAEDKKMKPVLLYCGDFDPAGALISDQMKKNLNDLSRATDWTADNLIVDRFGLNFDFIEKAGLSWINNLITGSGKNLASPDHKDHHRAYVQNYMRDFGVRKCEANALVVQPDLGKKLCLDSVTKYLGGDALGKYKQREEEKQGELQEIMNRVEMAGMVEKLTEKLDEDEKENGDGE